MKILLIRHGDPDYAHDSLTEKGRREAALLAERMAKVPVKDFYVSPLGRARVTASYTLEKVKKEAKVLDWLEEFKAQVDPLETEELRKAYVDVDYRPRIVWDMMPGYWTEHPEYFSNEGWKTSEVAAHSDMEKRYAWVAEGLDRLLASYGYEREGSHYRVEQGNEDTIAIYCHFGVSCVILSHLWGISPFILWHSLAMAPTSVTELVTEERQKGSVFFRSTVIGDVSHLYMGGEEPSFAGRFCETYENWEERH